LQQLGFDAEQLVKQHPGLIWISITGHGRAGKSARYTGFGDDAAAAGGLILEDQGKPCFLGDAVADPLAGMHAALAASIFWKLGRPALLDISLSETSRYVSHTLKNVGMKNRHA
jgi:crotonobetainyl-CoA:carnitine CoA-transferase CaiB-like acyl-CoA transferase